MIQISTEKISVWDGTVTEIALIRSMISLLQGKTDQLWVMGEDSSAGLVLTGNLASDRSERKPLPVKTGHRLAALLLAQDDPDVAGAVLCIRRPIRVMPLIELLNEAGKQLAQQRVSGYQPVHTQPVAVFPPASLPTSPLVAAAQALRQLRKNPTTSRPTALLNNTGGVMAVVHAGPGIVITSLALGELVKSIGQTFRSIQPVGLPPNQQAGLMDIAPQSLDALCWKVGIELLNTAGLASWLNNDTVYRLMGWPDFGAIGADRHGMRLSAAMLAQPMSLLQLSEKTRIGLHEVSGFFNSASVSGLLVEAVDVVLRPAPVSAPTAAVNAPRRSMISMLRSKLGLS